MKLFTGCWALSLWLILLAGTAGAQVLAPAETGGPAYRAASDFSGPYGDAVPREAPPYAAAPQQAPPYAAIPPQAPPYAAMPPEMPEPGYGPALLPPGEVYAILRGTGFRPLGEPRRRGMLFAIAVVDRYGEEGRLVIDARTGQIVRFVPIYRMGDAYGAAAVPYAIAGRQHAFGDLRDPPRPPASVPNLAGRAPAVPMPKPAPPRSVEERQLSDKPAQSPQQSAAVQAKPADAAGAQVAPAVTEARPAAQIQPTRPMPSVQGLE